MTSSSTLSQVFNSEPVALCRKIQKKSADRTFSKTGSLCCVAARPDGSNATSREWPIGPHEPYWQTNTSFSPPPPRWDYRFQSEGIQHGSNDSIQLFESTSSNSKESRSWIRGGYPPTHQHSASECGVLFFSSPSDNSLTQPWTPPPMQGINIDEHETTKRDQISGLLSLALTMKGTSMVPDGGRTTSFRSDGSESESTGKLQYLSTPRNFPGRHSFMSKPVHPLSFPVQARTREPSRSPASGFPDFDTSTPQRDTHRVSSGSSSIDLTDISLSEPYEFDNPGESLKCGLCDRFLSQRSPWSSRRIVKSGDMPITGVLFCRHVFHAECLEQTTPKSHRSDPPCPLCNKVEVENQNQNQNSPEQCVIPRLRNNFLRLNKPPTEEGSSRTWGCVQAGDCVEGALHTPQRSSVLKIKKNLSLKGNSGKDFSGKLKKTGSYPLHHFGGKFNDHGGGGCSKTSAGPSMNK